LIGEEFILLYQAKRVLSGEVPYRDFFQFITPGSIYLAGLAFKLFGSKLLVVNFLTALVGSSIVILTYSLAKQIILKTCYQLIPPLMVSFFSIPFVPLFYHHWNAEVFVLLGLMVGTLYISRDKPYYLFLFGVFAGATFLFVQHRGILMFVSGVIFLVLDYIKKEKGFLKSFLLACGGFLLPVIVFIVFLVYTGSLEKFYYNCFTWVREWYLPFNSIPDYLYFTKKHFLYTYQKEGTINSVIKLRNQLFLGYLPLAVITGGIIILIKNYNRKVMFLYAVSLFLFLSVLQRPDFINILYVSQPFIVLFVYSLEWISNKKSLKLYVMIHLFLILLILNTIYGFYSSGKEVFSYRFPVETPAGNIYFKSEEDKNTQQELLSIMESEIKDRKFFAYNWSPFLYFFLNSRNYTSFDIFLPAYNTPEQMDALIEELKVNNIEYVIYDSMDIFLKEHAENSLYPAGAHLIEINNKLNAFIDSHYETVHIIRNYKIMKRKANSS